MKISKYGIVLWMAAGAVIACGKDTAHENGGGGGKEPAEEGTDFVLGADLSWVSEMEHDGVIFKGADGRTADIYSIMKGLGLQAARFRVWVNPAGGWSGKEDVTAQAKRAAEAGMEVMIDFHYSDFFADPSRQTIPEEWAAEQDDLAGLAKEVAGHTADVLAALKTAGVTPRWVQLGNETRNGFLWPAGQLWTDAGDLQDGWRHLAALMNAGYDAAKSVFPNITALVHLNNAWEDNAWWFSKFKAAGGKFDGIALSHYPQSETDKTWRTVNAQALSNIRTLAATYQCKVMVAETGVKASDFTLAAQVLQEFMDGVKKIDACEGVFYWEPEVYGSWKPAVYNELGWTAYDMGAFNPDGSPSMVLSAFTGGR